ncbi:MAG: oligosaccharide repeat unit polymerase [Bacteroidales bacterium]|nr:oligosaccharide repeat unit polymerase [Bacteroidales bacterium]
MEIATLIFMFIALLSMTIWYYKKKTFFKIGLLVLGIYTFSALMSIIFYVQPASVFLLNGKITFWPCLYWLVVFYFTFIPISKFDRLSFRTINYNINLIRIFMYIGVLVSIIPFFEQIVIISRIGGGIGSNFATGLAELHDDEDALSVISPLSRFLLKINTSVNDFAYIVFLVAILQPKIDQKIILSALFIIATRSLMGVVSGHRTGFVEVILKFCVIACIVWPIISNDRKKILKKIGFIVLCFFGMFFIVITVGRHTYYSEDHSNFTLLYFLSRYLGEGFVNFSQYLPYMKNTTDGYFCLWSEQWLLGMNPPEYTWEYSRGFLTSHQGIPQRIFYTYIGNFVQDFGFIFSFVILTTLPIVIGNCIKTNSYSIDISFLYLFISVYITIMVYGFTSYKFVTSHSKYLLYDIVFYIVLRIFEQKKQNIISNT